MTKENPNHIEDDDNLIDYEPYHDNGSLDNLRNTIFGKHSPSFQVYNTTPFDQPMNSTNYQIVRNKQPKVMLYLY